jgi:hypothetical protein
MAMKFGQLDAPLEMLNLDYDFTPIGPGLSEKQFIY